MGDSASARWAQTQELAPTEEDGWRTVTRGKSSSSLSSLPATAARSSGHPNGESKQHAVRSAAGSQGPGSGDSRSPLPLLPQELSTTTTQMDLHSTESRAPLLDEDSGIGLEPENEALGRSGGSPSYAQMMLPGRLHLLRTVCATPGAGSVAASSDSSSPLVADGQSNSAAPSPSEKALQNGVSRSRVRRLSVAKIEELTSSPESLSLYPAPFREQETPNGVQPVYRLARLGPDPGKEFAAEGPSAQARREHNRSAERRASETLSNENGRLVVGSEDAGLNDLRPNGLKLRSPASRPVSTPTVDDATSGAGPSAIKNQAARSLKTKRSALSPLQVDSNRTTNARPPSASPVASPMPTSIPLPPMSLPTYLQLELSSMRPSPLYIHRPASTDFPYESSKVKFERLLSFLLLPPQLELTLWFGALACLDAWLYSFTILPLRFLIALGILARWWLSTLVAETRETSRYVFLGLGRMWTRNIRGQRDLESTTPRSQCGHKSRSSGKAESERATSRARGLVTTGAGDQPLLSSASRDRRGVKSASRGHRRTHSVPSALLADHKADLLKGLVVLFSCLILMRFDASRMYHGIRGQAAIKLYVIYNVLEVCDRLFSALGQDVFECLFSKETLERRPDGRSKLLRPFGMFLLALGYNVIHSTALFYQVITLNVAVNSYSNALLTLLMSNQFVEIKSTVFKKFERENLFQLTCADVVERFQLWLMLLIIALRNIAEVGGLSLGGSGSSFLGSGVAGGNSTGAPGPRPTGTVIPKSFTIFPKWSGQVLGPFLLVLGSETLVDWLKHAYITKFNNTKPAIYGRFLDVLAKDYYSNAFSDQNLTRRLGLPVIPLSCLFIRASLQTYHMFLATSMPLPIASSATSLSVTSATTASPATTAALQHFDTIIRRALGRSSFGAGGDPTVAGSSTWSSLARWTADDAIALTTMVVFFIGVFLVLLALKLVLGMVLLAFARRRYRDMKERENDDFGAGGRRVGGWGVVDVDEDKRRWIYQDDPNGARASREREKAVLMREQEKKGPDQFAGISRYTMVAKRIW